MQGVSQCLRKKRTDGDRARLTRARHTQRVERRKRYAMSRFDARYIQARGQVIIHEGAVEQLPIFVVGEPLVKRIANALRHTAMQLQAQGRQLAPGQPTEFLFTRNASGVHAW